MTKSETPVSAKSLLDAQRTYAVARRSFLDALQLPESNRDPLSEFAELLVAKILGGKLAPSRVQKGWDIELQDGQRVQVKFLANRRNGDWVNEHEVEFAREVALYALVVFRGLLPESVVVFAKAGCQALRTALDVRSNHQRNAFTLTECRYDRIVEEPEKFARFGVEVHWFE